MSRQRTAVYPDAATRANSAPYAPASPSFLAQQAALLSAGQSLRLSTNITAAQLSPEGSDILQWSIRGYYDALRKEVGFIGKRDGSDVPYHWLVYSEATDAWSVDPRSVWDTGNTNGHGYCHNTIDPATGDVYHVPYGVKIARKWNGTSWSSLPAWTQNTTATGGLTYFPGVGLCYNDGVYGLIKFNGSTWDDVFVQINGSYHDFGVYNAAAGVLIFGGGNGNGYYKWSGSGSPTSIQDPSTVITNFRISANAADQGIVCSDPNAAKLVARYIETGAWAAYDIASDTWTQLTQSSGSGSAPQSGTPNLANSASNSEICVSLDAYGCTMWLQFRSGTTMDCWLYRHS